ESFAKIVVGIPFQFEGDALGYKRPKTLPSRALEMQVNGVFRQALGAKTPRQFTAQNSADDAMRIADGQRRLDLLTTLQGWLCQVEQRLVVERILQAMILGDLAVTAN